MTHLRFDQTELVLIYQPVPTKSLPGKYIWFGHDRKLSNNETIALARIDASGAKLKAARHSDLVSLNFSFDRLFIVVNEDVRLVPEGEQCGIYEKPGTDRNAFRPVEVIDSDSEDEAQTKRLRVLEIVDSRPLLVVEFPPQHLSLIHI